MIILMLKYCHAIARGVHFHYLAMIMAQVRPPSIRSPGEMAPKRKTIKRQPMQDRLKPVKYDVQQETYSGFKKPLMPTGQAVHHVAPLSLLASQAITNYRTLENEFAFSQDIHTESVFRIQRLHH